MSEQNKCACHLVINGEKIALKDTEARKLIEALSKTVEDDYLKKSVGASGIYTTDQNSTRVIPFSTEPLPNYIPQTNSRGALYGVRAEDESEYTTLGQVQELVGSGGSGGGSWSKSNIPVGNSHINWLIGLENKPSELIAEIEISGKSGNTGRGFIEYVHLIRDPNYNFYSGYGKFMDIIDDHVSFEMIGIIDLNIHESYSTVNIMGYTDQYGEWYYDTSDYYINLTVKLYKE